MFVHLLYAPYTSAPWKCRLTFRPASFSLQAPATCVFLARCLLQQINFVIVVIYRPTLSITSSIMAPFTRLKFFVILILVFIQSISAEHLKRTLIIVDNPNEFNKQYADLIKTVQDLGQTVDVKPADSSSLKIKKYGEYLYENILVFSSKGTMTDDIVDFIDADRNVLLAGSNSLISQLANQVGFELNLSKRERAFKNIKVNPIIPIIGKSPLDDSEFTYTGTELKMLKSELTMEILSNNAPVDDIRPDSLAPTKYVTNVLIGCMQARNNARVVVSGSSEFFSDKALKGANKQLTVELLRWLFKEKALLRYSDVKYATNIAITDIVQYSIKIEHYVDGKWVPYAADDVQLEFVRIDPFVRITMQHKSDGTYFAEFKVPDVYGVYKFQVDYIKEGLTRLFSSNQVSVRPLRHNEYERFIYSAYPYYLSAFLMMAYLYIFSFVYLYQHREKRNTK